MNDVPEFTEKYSNFIQYGSHTTTQEAEQTGLNLILSSSPSYSFTRKGTVICIIISIHKRPSSKNSLENNFLYYQTVLNLTVVKYMSMAWEKSVWLTSCNILIMF